MHALDGVIGKEQEQREGNKGRESRSVFITHCVEGPSSWLLCLLGHGLNSTSPGKKPQHPQNDCLARSVCWQVWVGQRPLAAAGGGIARLGRGEELQSSQDSAEGSEGPDGPVATGVEAEAQMLKITQPVGGRSGQSIEVSDPPS